MIHRNVLVVDDDRTLLKIVQSKLNEGHEKEFSVITASDGLEAIEVLKKHLISLVLTDLQMPRLDGFGLLAHMTKYYPDISVFIMTAYDETDTQKRAISHGAASYIKKPFKVKELTQRIFEIFRKESEGGNLFNVSLEMYLQIIEMEQKTCTLRIIEKKFGHHGTIFFKDGLLLNARFKMQQGIEAAYEILSWGQVSLSIEECCSISEKVINEDTQAILLEAMRRKDEREDELEEEKAEVADGQPDVDSESDIAEDKVDEPISLDVETKIEDEKANVETSLTNEEKIRHRIEQSIGRKSAITDIYSDSSWNGLIDFLIIVGKFVRAGSLKACYLNKKNKDIFVLVPGDEDATVISLPSQRQKDKILEVLVE